MATVRLFTHHPQLVTSAPPLTSAFRVQSWVSSLVHSVHFLLVQPPGTRLPDPIFAPFKGLLDSLPPCQLTAEQETYLVLLLVHMSTQPRVLPSIPEPWSSFLPFSSTCLFEVLFM